MSPDSEAVLQAALALSESERLVLVNRILESLPEQAPAIFDDEEFQTELERRANDSSEFIPWSQVRKEL